MEPQPHQIRSIDAIRKIVGEPHPALSLKVLDELDEMSIGFIGQSPFLVLATADEHGCPDVSPKGDHPGFVAVENPRTLLIPERKGNKLLYSLQNILANPRIAAIFLVPGTGETLRVQGRATLTDDPGVCQRLAARGQPALLAIRVDVEKCFFHCARAFKRASLWQPEAWPQQLRISFGRQVAPRLGGGDDLVRQIDEFAAAESHDL
jgi:PPOX class probable FMN-dependent enzyme